MKRFKKIAAAVTAFSVAATMAACSGPTIGTGTSTALTIDNYKVPAGVFIFYTINSYYEAYNIVYENTGAAPTIEDVKESHIDELESTDWIQNKATEYCENFVAIEKEFEKIGGELTAEELDEVQTNLESFASYEIYSTNGIGESSIRALLENEYKTNYVFDHYYGFESENGMSEDELKDYFDENFARVKYVSMSLLDPEGNELEDDAMEEVRELAEQYAERVNSKSDVMDKLFEMDAVKEDYNEYVAEQKAAMETGTTTTTTTTTTASNETTTTTTTDPYANEYLMQKNSTTTAEESDETVVTTTTTESAATKSMNKLNDFVFEDLGLDEAVVFDDGEDTLYVVIRADLRERMTEDDYWSEDYITSLQTMCYNEDFADLIEEIAGAYSVDKNKSAYRRYAPFKLVLEVEQ